MTEYIWRLPRSVQSEIMLALDLAGIEGEDFERAMDSRLCDLEDTIDIRPWIVGRPTS